MIYSFSALSSPGPNLIDFGPIVIRWYGLLIAIAVLTGLNLCNRFAAIQKLRSGLFNDLLPFLVLSSIIGARLYYVIFEWRNYSGDQFWSILTILGLRIRFPAFLEIWGGGIAIHGALIAGSICVLIYCRVNSDPFWRVVDLLMPSLVLGQAIGRWGNFFNNEAFGLPTNLPWKLFIPYYNRPNIFLNENYFHPTFLYESIWDLAIFTLLILLINRKGLLRIKEGTLTCIYLITYSIGRFWIEGLRLDPLCIASEPPFCNGGIKVAQLISILLFSLGVLGLFFLRRTKNGFSDQIN